MTDVLSLRVPVLGVAGTASVPEPAGGNGGRRRVVVVGVDEVMAVSGVQGRSQGGAVAQLVRHALRVCGVLATVARGGQVTSAHGQILVTLRGLPPDEAHGPEHGAGPGTVQPWAESCGGVDGAVDGPEF